MTLTATLTPTSPPNNKNITPYDNNDANSSPSSSNKIVNCAHGEEEGRFIFILSKYTKIHAVSKMSIHYYTIFIYLLIYLFIYFQVGRLQVITSRLEPEALIMITSSSTSMFLDSSKDICFEFFSLHHFCH